MFRSATRALFVLTLCLAVSGNWLALQPIAWAAMLVKNSAHASLAQALAETFDGQHPCGLCKGINAAQQAPKKNSAPTSVTKLDLICAVRVVAFAPRSRDVKFFSTDFSACIRADSPPTPPPRSELA